MAQICLWLMAGLMLCSTQARSLGGDLPCMSSLENRGLSLLLGQLQRVAPYACRNDRNDFRFPWQIANITEMQKTRCTCLKHLMFSQTFNLFNTNKSSDAWNLTILYKLLSRLHYSLDKLEPMKEETLVCPGDLEIHLRNYFLRIRNYLKKKKYSYCAWEIVRSEIQVRLFLM